MEKAKHLNNPARGILQRALHRLDRTKTRTLTTLLAGAVGILLFLEALEMLLTFSFFGDYPLMWSVFTPVHVVGTTLVLLLLLFTRRMLAREKLQSEAIAEYISDGILCMEESQIVFANAAARRILNISSSSAVLTASVPDAVSKVLAEASQSKLPMLYQPVVDGRQLHYLVSEFDLPKSRGSERRMYVFQDVTFLRENEEAKVNFIGTLAHEIKTPITSLSMALAMLERTGFDPELLRIANVDVSRLRVLLDDLLDVSKLKIVRNPNALQKRESNLTRLTTQMVKTASVGAHEKSVHINADLSLSPQIVALIDPTKISWVLSTLLSDAIQQSAPGAEIKLNLIRESEYAVFSVTYKRVPDMPGPTRHEIVRDIIEAHGGRFVAFHDVNRQSTLKFSIHACTNGSYFVKGEQGVTANEANLIGR